MEVINLINVLHVVTDNFYYFYGIDSALSRASEDGRGVTVVRMGIDEFLRCVKNENVTSLYVLAGPDSNSLLSAICGFIHFKLIREKKSIIELSSLPRELNRKYLNKDSGETKERIRFSRMEFDVFSLFVKGCDNNAIAKIKGLSPKTVSHYKVLLRKKLFCNSDMELMKLNPILSIIESNLEFKLSFVKNKITFKNKRGEWSLILRRL